MSIRVTNPKTGEEVELTVANAMVYVFPGANLNHVAVSVGNDGEALISYNAELVRVCSFSRTLPVVFYPERTEWAIERRMQCERETFDVDKLLDGTE